jgi:type IV pilus assembly protein PilQ
LSLSPLAFVESPASAAARTDIPYGLTMSAESHPTSPVLSGIQVSQYGGGLLRVNFRGFDMPLPRAASAPGEARLVLQWDGARFPQSTDERDWWSDYSWDVLRIETSSTNNWWKQYDLPLLDRVNAEPIGEDSLRLTFVTRKPMVIDSINGVAGADNMTVMLKVYEPEQPKPPAPAPKTYQKGDPMSITAPFTVVADGIPLVKFLELMTEDQHLNFMLDPAVPPDQPVTVKYVNIPFNVAFGYLMRAYDLAYAIDNGTIIIGKPESIGKTTGTEVVRGYPLSYAVDQNGQVRADITASLTALVPLSTTPVLDVRNRQLYVTATEDQHKEVANVLNKLDHPGRQVMLEARIFEVSDSGTQALESLVTAVYNHWVVSFTGTNGMSGGYNYYNGSFNDDNVWDSWHLPVAGSIGDSPYLEQFPVEQSRVLSAGLHALENDGKGKNIASPTLITLDGQKATVSLTRNYTYTSGVDSNGNATLANLEVGPQLSFTPVVGRDGIVTVNIEIETGTLTQFRNAGMGAQAPETSTRRVQTTVRVRNGEPFVVGGLYQDDKVSSRYRIPVLGYIPLLGDLFSSRNETHNKSEVAMIVIPYILDVPNKDIEHFDLKRQEGVPMAQMTPAAPVSAIQPAPDAGKTPAAKRPSARGRARRGNRRR